MRRQQWSIQQWSIGHVGGMFCPEAETQLAEVTFMISSKNGFSHWSYPIGVITGARIPVCLENPLSSILNIKFSENFVMCCQELRNIVLHFLRKLIFLCPPAWTFSHKHEFYYLFLGISLEQRNSELT